MHASPLRSLYSRPHAIHTGCRCHAFASARMWPPLGYAGPGYGSEALQQLVLIVADGRFHEKAALQRAVREVPSPLSSSPLTGSADWGPAQSRRCLGLCGQCARQQGPALSPLLKSQTEVTCHCRLGPDPCLRGQASARRGVLIAFIILDNPAASLLDMRTVSFVDGKPAFEQVHLILKRLALEQRAKISANVPLEHILDTRNPKYLQQLGSLLLSPVPAH